MLKNQKHLSVELPGVPIVLLPWLFIWHWCEMIYEKITANYSIPECSIYGMCLFYPGE